MPPRRYTREPDAGAGLPHDWDTEREVLGALLQWPEELAEVRRTLAPSDFGRPAAGELYALLCRLADRERYMGLSSVHTSPEWDSEPSRFGGWAEVDGLSMLAPADPALIPKVVQRMLDTTRRRQLIERCRLIETEARDPLRDVGHRLDALGLARVADGPGRLAEVGRSLGWMTPSADWIGTTPAERDYLLHDRPTSQYDALGAGMLPRGNVGLLAAAGGVGKTYALCGLALSLVTGRPWLGWFPVGKSVGGRVALILGEEDAAEVHRRMHIQARAMGLEAHHGAALTGIRVLPGAALSGGLALVDVDPVTRATVATARARELRAYLAAEAEAGGWGWDAVLVDPLSRFAGADTETDNNAATRLVEQLELFTTLPGKPTVIAAHHTRKATEDGPPTLRRPTSAAVVRGSSALVDGARWVGALLAGPDGLATFGVVKSNYAPPPKVDNETGLVLVKPEGGGIRYATKEDIARATRPASSPTADRAVVAASRLA